MLLCFQTLTTTKKNHHQGQGNPANERFQMLTRLFGHEKSATHTARNVRPFCNACHRSVAQGAPTASARSPSACSQAHTPRAEGPRERLEEVARVSRPRGCPPWCSALSSIFPCGLRPYHSPRFSDAGTGARSHGGEAECGPRRPGSRA